MSESENKQEQTPQSKKSPKETLAKVWAVLNVIGSWMYKFRKLVLALPVVVASVVLAVRNMRGLPEQVGVNILTDGTYAYMVPRTIAVLGPLAITALCLLLMMCSRKTLYPWIISVFSLVLPFVMMLFTQFPF